MHQSEKFFHLNEIFEYIVTNIRQTILRQTLGKERGKEKLSQKLQVISEHTVFRHQSTDHL